MYVNQRVIKQVIYDKFDPNNVFKLYYNSTITYFKTISYTNISFYLNEDANIDKKIIEEMLEQLNDVDNVYKIKVDLNNKDNILVYGYNNNDEIIYNGKATNDNQYLTNYNYIDKYYKNKILAYCKVMLIDAMKYIVKYNVIYKINSNKIYKYIFYSDKVIENNNKNNIVFYHDTIEAFKTKHETHKTLCLEYDEHKKCVKKDFDRIST